MSSSSDTKRPAPGLPGVPETREFEVHRYERGTFTATRDMVAGEAPLVILLNGDVLVRLRCLPNHQEALALGFLLSEGLIEEREKVRSIRTDEQGVEVWVEADAPPDRLDRFHRNLTLTTACGGGITGLDDLPGGGDPSALADPDVRFGPDLLLSVIRDLHERSEAFRTTGAVHAAALADAGGILLFGEDVGRHNAVDKVIGQSALKGIPLEDKILASSGRLTFEIVAKLARLRVPCVISRSAPSAQALEIAADHRVTVVGFARGRRFNLYTAPERILQA